MSKREANKWLFKFIVKNIIEHEGKKLPYSFIVPRIVKHNVVTEEHAKQFVTLMWKKGFITNEMHDGVYKLQVTKLACDQIRQWKEEEETYNPSTQEQTDDCDGMRLL